MQDHHAKFVLIELLTEGTWLVVFYNCSIVKLTPDISDERCGSFDDWGMKLEDFFTCHFFPAAEKIIEIDMRLAAEKPASDAVSAA